MTDVRAEIVRRCAEVGVTVHIGEVVCRVDGEDRSFTAIVEVAGGSPAREAVERLLAGPRLLANDIRDARRYRHLRATGVLLPGESSDLVSDVALDAYCDEAPDDATLESLGGRA